MMKLSLIYLIVKKTKVNFQRSKPNLFRLKQSLKQAEKKINSNKVNYVRISLDDKIEQVSQFTEPNIIKKKTNKDLKIKTTYSPKKPTPTITPKNRRISHKTINKLAISTEGDLELSSSRKATSNTVNPLLKHIPVVNTNLYLDSNYESDSEKHRPRNLSQIRKDVKSNRTDSIDSLSDKLNSLCNDINLYKRRTEESKSEYIRII
jgi:hypothetical protein